MNPLSILRLIGALSAALLLLRSNSSAQMIPPPDEKLFIMEVKQIDEFLERFNDEKFSFIRGAYRKAGAEDLLTRERLLTRLFNISRPDWNEDTVRKFIEEVLSPERPVYLSFRDTNWYAEAACRFYYGGRLVRIPMLLHIQTVNPKGARWMIAGLGNPRFLQSLPERSCEAEISPEYHFIPSSSHINRFVALHRVFADNKNLTDYFEPWLLARPEMGNFIDALCRKSIRLSSIDNLRFHFCQVKDWFFTVERFERNTPNRGWLINHLRKETDAQKKAYLEQLQFRLL